MRNLLPTTTVEWIWLGVGVIGQALFFCRFIVQWIASERAKRSVIPKAFWYLSLFGGLTILCYAVHKRDIVFIFGQLPGVLIYSRNLYFVGQEEARANALAQSAAGADTLPQSAMGADAVA